VWWKYFLSVVWKYFLCRGNIFCQWCYVCVRNFFIYRHENIFYSVCVINIFFILSMFERVPTSSASQLDRVPTWPRPNYRRPNYRRPNASQLSASRIERVPTWRPSASQRVPARPSASQRVPGRPNASRMSYLLRCCPGGWNAAHGVPARPNASQLDRVPTRPN
jgi:hypothetical protein